MVDADTAGPMPQRSGFSGIPAAEQQPCFWRELDRLFKHQVPRKAPAVILEVAEKGGCIAPGRCNHPVNRLAQVIPATPELVVLCFQYLDFSGQRGIAL